MSYNALVLQNIVDVSGSTPQPTTIDVNRVSASTNPVHLSSGDPLEDSDMILTADAVNFEIAATDGTNSELIIEVGSHDVVIDNWTIVTQVDSYYDSNDRVVYDIDTETPDETISIVG